MTVRIQGTDSINAPAGVVMTDAGDQYWLLSGVDLVTDTFIGVRMNGEASVVSIDGTILSVLPAVRTDNADAFVSVGSTGVLRSTGSGGPAVYLAGVSNRLVNDGLVDSVRDIAVFCQQATNSVVNTGEIRAGLTGVYLSRTVNAPMVSTLENHGSIIGGAANSTSSDLSAGVVLNAPANVVNFGTITSVSNVGGGGAGIGVFFIGAALPSGISAITNHGTVSSARNWGIDASNIGPSNEPGLTMVNTGLISGYLGSIVASGFNDTLQNSGTLSGHAWMGLGRDRIENTGQVLGDVNMGQGDDTFIGRSGSVTGVVLGDFGNDLLVGGDAADNMAGGFDSDTLRGGNGDDTLAGDTENDMIDGGRGDDALSGGVGIDTLQGGAGNDTITGQDDADLIYGGAEDDLAQGGNGLDTVFGDLGDDTLTGDAQSDALFGGKGDDSLDGGTDNDTVEGSVGNDTLAGGTGGDSLAGGAGADVLRGGGGRDTIAGGADADVFAFTSAADCGLGNSRDVITDFVGAVDRIDLSAIQAGQVFIGGAAFGNIAGQVRYDLATGLLSGDTNGNGVADFNLQLAAGTVLVAGDFLF